MLSNRQGKLNNHLEAAIHEAMSELDKMSGTVSIYAFLAPRERLIKSFITPHGGLLHLHLPLPASPSCFFSVCLPPRSRQGIVR